MKETKREEAERFLIEVLAGPTHPVCLSNESAKYLLSLLSKEQPEVSAEELEKRFTLVENYIRVEVESGLREAEDYGLSDAAIATCVQIAKDFASQVSSEKDKRIKKLQDFKDYVHGRLDEAGIEKNPEGKHSKHGCRIGDRLDIVLSRVRELEDKASHLEILLIGAEAKIETLLNSKQ